MSILKQRFIVVVLLLLPLMVDAAPPQPYRAKYSVSADNIPMGEMWRTLTKDGDHLEFRTSMKTTGFVALFKKVKVEEVSKMQWSEKTKSAKPLSYHYLNIDNGKKREEGGVFNYTNQKVSYTYDGETKEFELSEIIDRLSYQVNLAESIRMGEKEITFQVIDKGVIRDYQFKVVGQDQIKVPAGKFNVIEVERVSNDSDRKTRFWCAIEWDFMMVKITQDDDGHTITSKLQSYELIPDEQKASSSD